MKWFSLFTLGLVAWAVASVWLQLTPLQAGLLLCLYLALKPRRAVPRHRSRRTSSMFTIKHISLRGEERILQTATVRFEPGESAFVSADGRSGHSGTPATVWIAGSTGEVPLTGGTIFVMNDNGKTVSRYDLGASPVPIVGDGLSDPRSRGVGDPQTSLAA